MTVMEGLDAAKHAGDPSAQVALVELTGVRVRRGQAVTLDVPRLQVNHGEVLSVIGPNGAGKSTLLHAISLLMPITAGEIRFGGVLADRRSNAVSLRRRMAVVFQEPLLLDTTVRENVASGLKIRGASRQDVGERPTHWMSRFGVGHLAERQARQLSGGEAQRVSLARAFALQPELLLLDEPFSALDAPTRSSLFEEFEQILRESGVTTLFVTHDRTEAMRLGDRILVMLEGRPAQLGRPEEVFSSPVDERVAAFVGVENLIPGVVAEQSDGLALVNLENAVAEVVSDVGAGARVLVALRPEDVVVGPVVAAQVPATSARNRMEGHITRATPLGSQMRLKLDCGFPLVALITRRSFEQLALEVGSPVAVSFKATAAHLLVR